MTCVNLLPWRERHCQRQRQRFYWGLAIVCASAAALAATGHVLTARAVDGQLLRNGRLAEANAKLDADIALAARLAAEAARWEERTAVLRTVDAERAAAVDVLSTIAETAVAGVVYTALTRTEQKLVATGTARSNAEVAMLMRRLEASPRLEATRLGNASGSVAGRGRPTRRGSEAAVFELRMHVAPDAPAASDTRESTESE